jgi:hypothetical protein
MTSSAGKRRIFEIKAITHNSPPQDKDAKNNNNEG